MIGKIPIPFAIGAYAIIVIYFQWNHSSSSTKGFITLEYSATMLEWCFTIQKKKSSIILLILLHLHSSNLVCKCDHRMISLATYGHNKCKESCLHPSYYVQNVTDLLPKQRNSASFWLIPTLLHLERLLSVSYLIRNHTYV